MAVKRTGTEKKEVKAVNHMIQVVRAKEFDNGSIVFDMEINGIMVYGCNWIEGKKEDGTEYAFASFPSKKGTDGKYYHIAFAKLSDLDNKTIEDQIGQALA